MRKDKGRTRMMVRQEERKALYMKPGLEGTGQNIPIPGMAWQ